MKARHMRLSEEQSVCLTNNGKSYLTWSDTFSLTDFVSQNFNSIRQSVEKIEIKIVWISWMSWNFERFHEIQFQIDAKSVIPKKYIFQAVPPRYVQEMALAVLIFSEGFVFCNQNYGRFLTITLMPLCYHSQEGPPRKKCIFLTSRRA